MTLASNLTLYIINQIENLILIKFSTESGDSDETILPESIVWEKSYNKSECRNLLIYTYGIVRHNKIHKLIAERKQESSKDNSN